MKSLSIVLIWYIIFLFSIVQIKNQSKKDLKELSDLRIQLAGVAYKCGYLDGIKSYQDSLKWSENRFKKDSIDIFNYIK